MKEGIFIGPQINKLNEDHDFSTKLNATENRDGRYLKTSTETF